MKKDIEIPVVQNVYVVALKKWNEDFGENSWYAYLVNNTETKLEMAMIVSKAFGTINNEERNTGTFRHVFNEVEAKSSVKIELLENNVLQLNNEFLLSYFLENKLYDKKFTFLANKISDSNMVKLPLLEENGVLGE